MKIGKLMFLVFTKITKLLWGTGLGRFPLVYRVFDFLNEHLRPKEPVLVEVEGNKMYVAPSDIFVSDGGLSMGHYSELWRGLCKKTIKAGMNVVDVGAHIGYYTLLFAQHVGETGKVFAFEPDPGNYSLLMKNMTINGYENVVPVQKAVSNEKGQLKLFLDDVSSMAHTICGGENKRRKSVVVDTITLDEFFRDKDMQVDFIKMNIEGAEMAALQGASELIKKNRNLKMLIEVHVGWLSDMGPPLEEFLNKLVEHGFKLYTLNEKIKSVELYDATSLAEMYKDDRLMDLFCVKGENLSVGLKER